MSSAVIYLDAAAADEKFSVYKQAAAQQKLSDYYRFDAKLSTDENLSNLAHYSLNEESTILHLYIYQNVFLDSCSRWVLQKDSNNFVAVLNALGRIVSLYPEATQLIESFLIRTGDYLNASLQTYQSQDPKDIKLILLAYYRLIQYDKVRFEKYINTETISMLLAHESCIIRLLSAKVLNIIIEMAENSYELVVKGLTEISGKPILDVFEGASGVDYQFLEINEAKRLSNFYSLPRDLTELVSFPSNYKNTNKLFRIDPNQLSSLIVEVSGVFIAKISEMSSMTDNANSDLVHTESAKVALRKLAEGIQHNKPVMIVGKAGSGKTFLINELAKKMNCHSNIVKIHLGEQTDAKLLLGTYTSGEKPGSFEWRSGVLTTAVKEGRWVLIEDINKAPTEVLSVLLTLLEKREISIPSRGEVIKAANGFQLLATIRLDEHTSKRGAIIESDLIGMRLWEKISIDEPSEEELKLILLKRFSLLTGLIPKLISTYKSVKEIYRNPQFVSLNKGVHPRVVSVRDLVKLCQRITTLFETNQVVKADQLIESSVYDDIFAEAVDCFVGSICEYKAVQPLVQTIGEELEISISRISLFLNKHVPVLDTAGNDVEIGRAHLKRSKAAIHRRSANTTSFAFTNHSLRLMEQIGVAVKMCEPTLLVGETGTGKTTVVQELAKLMNKNLTVINVSQQTESGDLLGGYKPVNCKTVAIPILEDFEGLFLATFSLKKNEKFYKLLHKCFSKGQWKNVTKLWKEAIKMADSILKPDPNVKEDPGKKKKRKLDPESKNILLQKWDEFKQIVQVFEIQSSTLEDSFVFNFVEGSLVKAVRNGEWLLLDEVNLASADTLENIADLLSESDSRSILLSEKGEAESIKAHPDFRIFACMNPATDVGKRDLPPGIRSRFTEVYVHSPDRDISDLLSIIDKYISKYSVSDEWVGNDIAELYLEAKRLAESNKIVDGSNQRPHFSIRTLTRTLLYVTDIVHIYGLRRSLYEGFCMAFLTLLNLPSEELLRAVIEKFILGRMKNPRSIMSRVPLSPGANYVQFRHYWMKQGPSEIIPQPHYIITPFVEKNMLNLVRASSGSRFPVLIQGPTSAGKTSMIKYLADITGHKFVRINNHEHTDLQEYLGTYVTDDTGKLSFKEGILVDALKKGHWIVLDELNLAPTDVLEALNRLLDDNRELFIPETQEIVHPHPDFMLFATQNPAGIYGGRKVLSRAFRNRFLELHFDDIPQDELEIILKQRCEIAPSYAKKIVEVYRQLSVNRSANRLFEQKNSFATLRDLFRWALRPAVGYEQLAANGYMLLAERCRSLEEKEVVKNVLQTVMKVELDMDEYYTSLEDPNLLNLDTNIVWTKGMRRLAVLVNNCLKNNEPVLLVGETGCGKTTIFQLVANYYKKLLVTINAHQNTETGDILGAQRPVRNRSEIQSRLTTILRGVLAVTDTEVTLDELLSAYDKISNENVPEQIQKDVSALRESLKILFEWCDGPLVKALKSGSFFLFDEISLADDSVLERLNSVLETERSILLAEKGTVNSFITAANGFQFFATMNPGGDYGKKELSPALKNRFTEIWVPSMEDFSDVEIIVSARLDDGLKSLSKSIVDFSQWFAKKFGAGKTNTGVISLRDILAWVDFINTTIPEIKNPELCLYHGAAMVFIDALGTNNTAHLAANEVWLNEQKLECVRMLSELCCSDLGSLFSERAVISITENKLYCGQFSLNRSAEAVSNGLFTVNAPTTAMNMMRVVRALNVRKPILLEGSPGVGKTSLVSALAEYTGNTLTRINLSEQTDLVDLFGFDAPGERTGEFVWRDAPFLRAMQNGEWVLLDEMNLASQSVLEGLNACLDHRGEAYIPELDKVFTRHPNFLVFAAQNPQYQGGGRKGLPKSFVNRFSVVYVDMLTAEDLLLIATHMYPNVDVEICAKMIQMISRLEDDVSNKKLWGSAGSPWEFNLRDTLRWLKLLNSASICEDINAADFLEMIVRQRFRTEDDQLAAGKLISEIFGETSTRDDIFKVGNSYLQVNSEVIDRNPVIQFNSRHNLVPLQCNTKVYESVLRCVKHNWPLILVGPTNSGKTDTVKLIASIIGKKTVEFSMNNDVDSMDILGGYEQLDLNRKIADIIQSLTMILQDLLVINLTSGTVTESLSPAFSLYDFITHCSVTTSNFAKFKLLFQRFFSLTGSNSALVEINKKIGYLYESLQKPPAVKFEWFDGMLVKAVEEGHWLILDNANLCSPSVLDRINSLLETNGTLMINECSLTDGKPRVVKPHPDFRLFLTMDPKFGELSRAMRNRGIEIFINDLSARASVQDKKILGFEDFSPAESYDDFEQKLSLLRLNNSSVAKKPLSSFISPRLSKLQSLVDVHDMCLIRDVSPYLISSITLNSVDSINNWVKNVRSSKLFDEIDLLESIDLFVNFISASGKLTEIEAMYAPLEKIATNVLRNENEFCHSQILIPTLNSYVSSTIRRELPSSLTSESVFFFASVWYALEAKQKLDFAQKKAINGKINELSYLETSAAVAFGRNIKNIPKIEVFKLLHSLVEFTLRSITNVPLFSIEKAYGSLFQLYTLWVGAFSCSKDRDEAKLRVYQELFKKWASTVKSILPGIDEIQTLLEQISLPANLRTGSSMCLIWEEVRRQYPLTSEAWNLLEQLELLSGDFDSMVARQFFDSYPQIDQLSQTFNGLFMDILNNETAEFDHILTKLKEGISGLDTISSTFLIKRKHSFKNEFTSLLRLLVNEFEETRELIHIILPNCSVSCMDLTRLDCTTNVHPPIFDLLWKKENGKYTSQTKSVFNPILVENVLSKSSNLNQFAGGQIEQTLRDAKVLIESIMKSTKYLLNDQRQGFSSILNNWILQVVAMHLETDSTASLSDLSIEELHSRVTSSECHWFKPVFIEYLGAALFLIRENTDLNNLGKAWVLFAAGLLQLYVPSSPHDPAIQDYVIYDNFTTHKSLIESLVDNWKCAGSVIVGDGDCYTQQSIPKIASTDEPKKPRVFRPNSSIDSLFDEWAAFMVSTVDVTPVISLLESSTEYNSMSASRFQMFEQNTSQFLSRLSTTYRVYSDINDIFAGYVYAMKFGFNLISLAAENEAKQLDISPLFPVDCLAVTKEVSILNAFTELNKYLKNQSVNSDDVERITLHFLNLCYAHKDSINMTEILNQILQPIYYRWSLRRMKSEQEAEQKGSLFKFNDNSNDVEAEFKRMFPDYEETLSLESHVDESSTSPLADTHYEIANTYIKIFENTANISISELVRRGSDVSVLLLKNCSDFKSYQLNESMLFAAVKTLSEKTNSFQNSTDIEMFDFYRGNSITETKKAMHVIQCLWNSVNTLLKEWPEHATLQDLFRVCEEFMTYPVSTPMARLLQKLEQIYTFVVEWQKYASSKVSLQAHVDSITDLIVSWRRLELHTWKALFRIEDLNSTKSIGNWWFYLFETIIVATENAGDDISARSASILSALNVFFSKSTFGEFGNRLRLVNAFCKHVSLMYGQSSTLTQSLQNITSFYEQFTSIVNEKIKSGKKVLEKEISEVILLASWKDVNIDALKQSSRRSHNSLFKIVRKYRALLSEPLTSVIENGIDPAQPVVKHYEKITASYSRSIDLSKSKAIVSEIPGWEMRGKALKDIFLTDKNLSVYVAKISNQTYPDLLEYALSVSDEAKRLREETPSVYKKDKKKLLATLKTQKSKLLSDCLKELKRIGLKSNYREDIRKIQQNVVSVLTNSKSFQGTGIADSDEYFFRILDLLPRLKNAVAFPSEDIPATYLERGMAMVENLTFSLIASRQPLFKLAHAYKEIEGLKLDLESISLDCNVLQHSNISHNFETFRYVCKWLPQMIDYIIEYAKHSIEHGISNAYISYLNSCKQKLVNFFSQSERFRVYSDATEHLLQEFHTFIEDLLIGGSSMNVTDSSFVHNILVTWLQQALNQTATASMTTEVSFQEIDSKLRRISTAILLSVQKLVDSQSVPISEDDDKWLTEVNRRIVSNIRATNCNKILALIEDLVITIKSQSFSPEASLIVSAAVSFTMPFVNHYFTMLNEILNSSSDNYYKLSKSTYIFSTILHNLGKDGFCSPEPPSEETENDNLQEGTGLGDGEGAQNNSKDIEEDEDLLEDAQQPNKDQRNDSDEDEEDEQEAVDMEGDIAGDLENASDQENEDDDDNKDEEEELDEEIDNLDDDDPNALDEKMWEEEAEEDSTEKESDKMPENSNADDVQASEEQAEDENGKPHDQEQQQEETEANDDENDDGEEEEEEDVGEQEDEVRNDENDELETNVPEVETMDLPEDMNLDSDNNNEDDPSGEEDDLEDKMDVDEEDEEEGNPKDNEENQQADMDENLDAEEDVESTGDIDMDEDKFEDDANQADEADDPDVKEEEDAVDSNDELEEQKDDTKQEGGEDETGDDVEGLDGLENTIDDNAQINNDTAVEQDSGTKGEGSTAADADEQQDVGSSGNAQSQNQEDNQEEITDSSRKEAQESLKQLGDSLKEFHRRHQEIKEASKNSEEQQPESSDQVPDEFEHVDGANTETDTQAMGSADKDQLTGFDEDLAIDDESVKDEIKPKLEDVSDQKQTSDMMDVDESEVQNGEMDNEENNGKSKGAFIGERNNLDEYDNLWNQNDTVSDENDIDQLLSEVDHEVSQENSQALAPRPLDEARDLWKRSEQETTDLAAGLSEQLRLILEPTLATKLKGDYKTGKRLNMKRIIPYIASQYRKDKIWLRRTKPSKRQYQIMIAVDDSKSMSESKSVNLAFQSICLVSKALTQLESGGLSIVKFGETVREVHPFNQPFNTQSGAQTFQWFDFQETRTDVKKLVAESIKIFERARAMEHNDLWQLEIIISDGVCEDHETLIRLVRRARENKIMLVFVVIDGINSNESIMDMSQVNYTPDQFGNMKLSVQKYLDTFPFEFYVVVHDINELPEMLSIILRQYFSEMASM
ncbi:unnamed protein product [Kluyveromyces dobzhanskii CBS 2104]|uniref:Midasin n=1 Tax=Kluyveromyces dobzhanskii CBS 2104 TaxID=1427455 RepID=A0A0A8LBM6_9SACH|nr:unnamed protein product [Kluyveromyces dobzhanskii CBS 2104]